ncbi:2518_t:CDS:2 [Cetraspora pellucida]|uniref:2518_t:CDS:1 n=1 Tax=Cetraspora pellucida TaxID=1433469 RepID=A0A9N9NFH3_9GLOM|nr:2518_t:CDS:2 [Cetraspora pellucida]
MQYRIEDIIIPDRFVNIALGCLVMNKALNKALGWNLKMAPNFSLRYNPDHITKLEGEYKDPIKDNVLSSLYTIVIQNNNSKNQTFDSFTKIDTKEKPASNEKKEFQVSDSFTEDLKKI